MISRCEVPEKTAYKPC